MNYLIANGQTASLDGAATRPTAAQLHTEALNSLISCQHMLTATEPMYNFALQNLQAAQQAITALVSVAARPTATEGARS